MMERLKKYIPILTFLLGSFGGGALTGATMGATALANIKENKADILECKDNIRQCRNNHQEILIAINGIGKDGDKIERLIIDLFKKLGHDHLEHKQQ